MQVFEEATKEKESAFLREKAVIERDHNRRISEMNAVVQNYEMKFKQIEEDFRRCMITEQHKLAEERENFTNQTGRQQQMHRDDVLKLQKEIQEATMRFETQCILHY